MIGFGIDLADCWAKGVGYARQGWFPIFRFYGSVELIYNKSRAPDDFQSVN
jgi:hypothetical protein